MKYFSHDCDASAREWLDSVVHERFGHEGYVLWFKILEVLGEEIEKQIEAFRVQKAATIHPIMTIGLKWLANRCKSDTKRVLEFAKFCKQRGKYSVVHHNKRTGALTIEVPNFLKRIDEYARKTIRGICKARGISPDTVLTVSGQTPDKLRTHSSQRRGEEKRGEEKRGEGGRAARAENVPPPHDSPPAETTEPAPPVQDPGIPPGVIPDQTPTEEDLEALEVACDVQAFQFCESPGPDAKRRAIRDLRRLGRSHEHIRHAAGLESSQTRSFFEIIRDLEHKRIPPPFRASPPAEKPVLTEPFLRERLIAAQDEADRRLAEMPPAEVAAWKTEEETAAAKTGISPKFWPSLVQSRLRLRAAERFGIEGLSKAKELA